MKSYDRPVLIVPGIGNSGPSHWQTLWEQSVPAAERVEQAEWEEPGCADWCEALHRAVSRCATAPLIVAHSLGCLAFVHWAQGSFRRVAGALLVAAPDPEAASFPSQARGFTPLPQQPLEFPSIVVASSNDPYATLPFAESCARAWGSRLVSLGAAGHINAESGLGRWEQGLALLDELRGSE